MHGIIPPAINRQGFISQSGLIQLAQAAAQFGLSGGYNDTVGAQGITPTPQLLDACFAIIDDNDGNRHAWTELSLFEPDNPKRMVSGRYGTIGTGSSLVASSSSTPPCVDGEFRTNPVNCHVEQCVDGVYRDTGYIDRGCTPGGGGSSSESSSSDADGVDDQVAWGLNGESYSPGTIVYVVRINYNAWGIVGGCCDGSSSSDDSDSFCFEVDCDAGTINVIDCDEAGGGGGTSSSPRNPTSSDENPTSSDPVADISKGRDIGGYVPDGGGGGTID